MIKFEKILVYYLSYSLCICLFVTFVTLLYKMLFYFVKILKRMRLQLNLALIPRIRLINHLPNKTMALKKFLSD
jgi:hypothetical protein